LNVVAYMSPSKTWLSKHIVYSLKKIIVFN
jgi:hypothetical protein